MDPQGAIFALLDRRKAVVYFERPASRDPPLR
jgi:hypothetical protein